jgi:hypothetical protein
LEMAQSMPRYPNLPVASKQIGCRSLVVDAYSTAVGWYAKYGFIAIDGPTVGGVQPMFIDLKTLQAASG